MGIVPSYNFGTTPIFEKVYDMRVSRIYCITAWGAKLQDFIKLLWYVSILGIKKSKGGDKIC